MSLFIVFIAYLIFYNKDADPKVILLGIIVLSLFYTFLYFFMKFGRSLGKCEIKDFEIRYTILSFIIYLIAALLFFYFHSIGIIHFNYEISYKIPIYGVILVCLHDLYFYGLHFLLHTRFFYKHVHYVHHLSKDTNLMSGYSFHPIEAIMYMFVLGILFLFDLNLYAFLFAIFMTDFITTLGHTGKEIFGEKYKKSIGFAIFTNSAHHFSHHYQNNGNLAGYFTYLDKLFGTYNKDYEHLFDKK